MFSITGNIKKALLAEDLELNSGISCKCYLQKVKEFGWGSILILRVDNGFIQATIEKDNIKEFPENLMEGSSIEIKGNVCEAKIKNPIIRSKNVEIKITELKIIHTPTEPMPFDLNKKSLNVHLDVKFDNRPIALRHPKELAIFKISEGIKQAFRLFLLKENFTEINTPKIVFAGAEGGANIFKIDYFGREAYLAQSPQFYKQMGVGIYNRVFEIAPVFRAEKSNTSRHVSEYISMDFEMGPIDSFHDVMNTETALLKFMMNYLKENYQYYIDILNFKLPEINEIPVLKLSEAHEMVYKKYKKDFRNEPDLEPSEEKMICDIVKKRFNSEFVFITHYPTKKRPFYTMDDPDDKGYTLSFDLLFRGLEITTGGQRLHKYNDQVQKLKDFDCDPDKFESYLQIHKHGMPPHGGLAIGLERLTANLIGLDNVKEAAMYPRDVQRLTP